ncbi:APC family permease [Candidatus Dependentiae bacterium]
MEMLEKNKFSLFTATMMNINVMVGAGAFIMPSLMARKASALSFLGWTSVAIIFFPLVWSISQITQLFSEQSSFYHYSEKGLNKTVGFISGWTYYLGYASMAATVNMALQEILGNQMKIQVVANYPITFNIIFIIIFCLLNLLNLSHISKIQNASTIFKLFPILFVISIMFFYYNPHLNFDWQNIGQVKYAIPLALFGFWGFESSSNISHLIKGGKKNASKSVLIGFISAGIIYSLFHFGLLEIMNVNNLINFGSPSFVKFLGINSQLFKTLLNGIVTSAIITSYASCVFGIFLSNSSNLHAMVNENLFPFSNIIKKTNKNNRPTFCVWGIGITSILLIVLINNKVVLTSVSNLGILISFLLTIISMVIIQKKKRVHFIKIIPTLLAFVSCTILAYYSWLIMGPNNVARLINFLPLVLLILGGTIVYKLHYNKITNS